VEILEEYHMELSRGKREKYLVKEKRINELKVNDICVIRNPTDKLHAHRKDNLGSYRVLEKRGEILVTQKPADKWNTTVNM
jgi:hypothetical protein